MARPAPCKNPECDRGLPDTHWHATAIHEMEQSIEELTKSVRAAEKENVRLRSRLASKHCGCAWCCASVPPEKRGSAHQRTCQPKDN